MRQSDKMLRDQLERMLNQSGVLVTPETFENTNMLKILEKGDNEWIATVGMIKVKITLKDEKYTVTIINK